jgi:hypothetical protein
LVSKAFVEGSRVALTFLVSKINRSFLHWNLPDGSSYILSVRPVAPSPWLYVLPLLERRRKNVSKRNKFSN